MVVVVVCRFGVVATPATAVYILTGLVSLASVLWPVGTCDVVKYFFLFSCSARSYII